MNYDVHGTFTVDKARSTVTITELPVKTWTGVYKEKMEEKIAGNDKKPCYFTVWCMQALFDESIENIPPTITHTHTHTHTLSLSLSLIVCIGYS
jgi:hypothetical protein